MKKLTLLLSTILCASLANAGHKAGEEACDMHAFSRYQANVFIHKNLNFDKSPKITFGNPQASKVITQFCDYSRPTCLENINTLLTLTNDKDIKINIYPISTTQSPDASHYLAFTYTVGGVELMQEFLHELHSLIKSGKVVDQNTLSDLMINLNINETPYLKKMVDQEVKDNNALAKAAGVTHSPSVYVYQHNATEVSQIYFSEYQNVPEYIIKRALNYLA
ncbi:thioredoxin domain-containing protein [Cysteiniphilum sp. QT6929]|uniref:thioredoxin domain-containing protein n=1 Tax=Cysteiniphilum sp. QT6929 TaxID=2975055 RepID=UPI0024B32456|nr:thioredoxin domain-containing protein [Cysteiniphilum sp. QT6929]WHN65019.1 thioredoxin domain-containing protein [Cysteiniphilum sp. QT6929]